MFYPDGNQSHQGKGKTVTDTFGCRMLVEGVEVVAYADNDGGLWYYHPVTGMTMTVKETDYDSRNIRDREEQGA